MNNTQFDINKFKDKTILITGANGLIGGTLAEYFNNINRTHNLNIKLILTSLSTLKNAKRINSI